MLHVSRGSSYYSMVITSGRFLCYSPCTAGSFPSCVSSLRVTPLLPEESWFWKGEQGARADSVLGFCTTRAIQVNLRCRKEGCYEVPDIGDCWGGEKRQHASAFPEAQQLYQGSFIICLNCFYTSLRHTLLVTVRNMALSIRNFLLIWYSLLLYLSQLLKCNLSINDSHDLNQNETFVTEFNVSVRDNWLYII